MIIQKYFRLNDIINVPKEEIKMKLYLSSYKLGNSTDELKKWLQNSVNRV